MSKIIICKGLPASGKSTWARAFVQENVDWKRVNKDDLRSMIQADKWSGKLEKEILRARDTLIEMWLGQGKNVVVDDTNLNPVHENRIREIAQRKGASVTIKMFDVDVEEAIKRDLRRSKSVGEKVIRKMYDTYLKPEPISVQTQEDTKKPYCVLVDIDGTIALMGDRSPYDWHRVGEDEPNMPIVRMVHALKHHYNIIFLSGRDGSCYDETFDWIHRNLGYVGHDIKLFMRPAGDTRKDSIVKEEILRQYILPEYYVDFIVDDRKQVVDMFRSLGLTVLQCAEGNF